jgi:nicotinamidase/pyrazinamidase
MTLGIILVDPQYDFFPGGSLAVTDGDQIVEPINQVLARHPDAPVFGTRDWHPTETRHFEAGGGIWPPHCVQDTRGAAYHDELKIPSSMKLYSKGTDPADDGGYSGFDGASDAGATLIEDLKASGVDSVLVAGLATDYCVKATVLDARKHGLEVFVYLPGVRAVNLKPEDGDEALAEMVEAGAFLVER